MLLEHGVQFILNPAPDLRQTVMGQEIGFRLRFIREPDPPDNRDQPLPAGTHEDPLRWILPGLPLFL